MSACYYNLELSVQQNLTYTNELNREHVHFNLGV